VEDAWRRVRAGLLTPLGAAIGLAASLATLGGAIVALTPGGRVVPMRMAGDLNVAIAPFTTNGSTAPEGAALSRDVAKALRSQLPRLDHSLQIEVRGPESVAPLTGRNEASRARSARALAQAIGADIVVYGEFTAGPQSTSLQPAFYLNAAKLPSASTLGGRYGYGKAISLPYSLAVSPPARAEIRATLIRRTEAYAETFIGVGYYLLHSLATAERHLRHVLASAPSAVDAALVRLLLGNVADQRGAVGAAARDYTLAARVESTHVRAQLGQAYVGYELAHGHCQAGGISATGLESAAKQFGLVLHTLGGLTAVRGGSALAAKAAFGAGQVYLCLSAARVAPRWRQARDYFAATIDAYAGSLAELRDAAAEAHAGIGLCELATEKAPTAYANARREYQAAAVTTTISSRRAYFEGAVGFADAQLGEYSSAVVMYRDAARIAGATTLGRTLTRRAARLSRHGRRAR